MIAYRLVAALNWRWTFYVGIISNGLALVLIAIFYWPPGFIGLHPEGKTKRQQFKELDFVGLLLFGGGLTIFLIGISWGNNPYSWRSVQVLVPLLLGGKVTITLYHEMPTSNHSQDSHSWWHSRYGKPTAPRRLRNCVHQKYSLILDHSYYRWSWLSCLGCW